MLHAVAALIFLAERSGWGARSKPRVNGGVDVNWAREHHGLSLAKQIAKGRVQEQPPPEGRPAPAE
jgi:hypothetical protein